MRKLLTVLLAALMTLPAVAGSPVTVYGPTYGLAATVSPLGEMRVENPASQLFLDTFNTAALDTINKWAATNGGTGVLPSSAVGASVLNGGTTANSFSKLTSIGSFAPSEPGFLIFNARVNLQSPLPTTATEDFGLGTSSATPTIAAPIAQCVCFEVTTGGLLQAVTYQTGTRVLIANLSALGYAPTDAAAHKYFIYFRGDITYWAIDDKDNVVAQFQTGASGPDINQLPLLFQVVSNSGTAATMQVNAVSLGDTSHTASTQNVFNGFTFEPQKSNTDTNTALVTLTAQGAGTVNSADQTNTNGRGVVIGINTTVDAAGSYTVAIQGKDVVSGQYYTIPGAITGAIAATGFSTLSVYPGIVAAANAAVSWPLPRTWRVQVVVTAGPITATAGASVIN